MAGEQRERDAAGQRAGDREVAAADAEQVAEQQLLRAAAATPGESASIPPSPNSVETQTATPTSAPSRWSRATSAMPAAATSTPADRAEQQRGAGERGDARAPAASRG